MPAKSPAYEIPEFKPEQNAVFGRVVQEFENIPTSTFVRSTANLTLTTAIQQVPSLSCTVAVPGNAIIHVFSILDMETTNVQGIGQLFVTNLGLGTTVIPGGAILSGTTDSGHQRTNVPQQWELQGLMPGRYQFSIRADKTSAGPAGSGARTLNTHSNLKVTVT